MSFKKNFRGATTYATPSNDQYRDNWDRIFNRQACEHAWGAATPSKHFKEVQVCTSCQVYRVSALGGWEEIDADDLMRIERSNPS